MANFETQIKQSQAQVAEAQGKISELTSRIEMARSKMAEGTDIAVDIENASLEEWKSQPAQREISRADLVAEVRAMLGSQS